MKFLSFVLCVFIFFNSLNSQNLTKEEMLDFYPNTIGNNWTYWWINDDFPEAGRDRYYISKDTTINSIKYSKIGFSYFDYGDYHYYLERIDTLTGNVFRSFDLSTDEISLVDNVYAEVGDTILISGNWHLLYCDTVVVKSIRDTVINGFATSIRELIGTPCNNKLYFAKNIGMLGSGPNFWIDSAYVDGIIFSNISSDITALNDDIFTVNRFILYQNYPNPFNPKTTIEYSIPFKSKVIIKIYNSLGKEVQTLVNKFKDPGNHIIEFDGSKYSSGIYIYRIITDRFSHSKKMILLK